MRQRFQNDLKTCLGDLRPTCLAGVRARLPPQTTANPTWVRVSGCPWITASGTSPNRLPREMRRLLFSDVSSDLECSLDFLLRFSWGDSPDVRASLPIPLWRLRVHSFVALGFEVRKVLLISSRHCFPRLPKMWVKFNVKNSLDKT